MLIQSAKPRQSECLLWDLGMIESLLASLWSACSYCCSEWLTPSRQQPLTQECSYSSQAFLQQSKPAGLQTTACCSLIGGCSSCRVQPLLPFSHPYSGLLAATKALPVRFQCSLSFAHEPQLSWAEVEFIQMPSPLQSQLSRLRSCAAGQQQMTRSVQTWDGAEGVSIEAAVKSFEWQVRIMGCHTERPDNLHYTSSSSRVATCRALLGNKLTGH